MMWSYVLLFFATIGFAWTVDRLWTILKERATNAE